MKLLYTIYVWLLLILATLFWGSLLGLALPFDRKGNLYFFISKCWAKTIIFLAGVWVKVEGLEKIPDSPCIFMSNHQSYFDVITLIASLPRPVRFVAKRILKFIPVFGQLIWASGHIIIDRANPKQAFSELDRAAEKINQGKSVLVFPEGTRSIDHKLGPFKKGGFVLTIKSRVPIMPISITGTQSMMPKGRYSFQRPKLIQLKISEPIHLTDIDLSQKQALMDSVRRAIIQGFAPETPEAKANQAELSTQGPSAA